MRAAQNGGKTMTRRRFFLAMIVLMLATPCGVQAQEADGMWYYREPDKVNCTGLTLRVNRNGNKVYGTATFGETAPMSRVTGSIDPYYHFSVVMTPTEDHA